MRNHSRKRRLNNSGLTLIELIVAIAIIAIFSGVVLTYITSSSNFTEIHQVTLKFRWRRRKHLTK